jgi:hypothetical protein
MLNSEMPDPMVEAQAQGARDRRNFLAACGKFAVITTSGDYVVVVDIP